MTARRKRRRAREVCGHGIVWSDCSVAHVVYGMCQGPGPAPGEKGEEGEEVSDLYRPEFEEAAKERDKEFIEEVERRAGAGWTRDGILAYIAQEPSGWTDYVETLKITRGLLARILGDAL